MTKNDEQATDEIHALASVLAKGLYPTTPSIRVLARCYLSLRDAVLTNVPIESRESWTHAQVVGLASAHVEDSESMDRRQDAVEGSGVRGRDWFRLWHNGPGLAWKPRTAPLLFSQRIGKTRTLVVGSRRFWYLKRWKSTRSATR